MRLDIDFFEDFGYHYSMIFQKCRITVNWCNFLIILDCSSCSKVCLYPLNHYIHITEDYLSKISISQHQWSSLQYCHNNETRCLVKNFVIFDFVRIPTHGIWCNFSFTCFISVNFWTGKETLSLHFILITVRVYRNAFDISNMGLTYNWTFRPLHRKP